MVPFLYFVDSEQGKNQNSGNYLYVMKFNVP